MDHELFGVWVGLLCAVTWAISSITLKDLASTLDPFVLNACRTLVGGMLMFLVTLATGRTAAYQMVTADRLVFLLASVLVGGGMGDACYIASIKRIGVSRAFPISSTYPALTLAFGVLFLQEKISWAILVGFALVTFGILLISNTGRKQDMVQNPLTASRNRAGLSQGILLSLAAALFWAVGMILIAPGIRGLDSVAVASFRTPALSLFLWGIATARGAQRQIIHLTSKQWLLLAVGGIMGWGVGSVLFLLTVDLAGPSRAAILTSTAPLFALPISVLLLKERITGRVALGTALTVAGIVLVS